MRVDLRVLTAAEIRDLMPMGTCVELMQPTMIAVSEGKAVLPLRSAMPMPGDIGMLGTMSGYLETAGLYGTKLVSLFPRNAGTAHSSHLGMLILFETDHGYPVGLLDAAEVTAIRTAAASGLATKLLAPAGASRLTVFGTGEQAQRHLEAMVTVRPIEDIRIWGRNHDKAKALAASFEKTSGIPTRAVKKGAEAAASAHIICTTTHASEPILFGEWVDPGTHLNVVGSSIPSTAEIDGALVEKSRFFIDYRESTLNQAGEFLRAVNAGLITTGHIAGEIGDVAAGHIAGRQSEGEITLYKSLGVAAQDIATGHYVLERAEQANVGQLVAFG